MGAPLWLREDKQAVIDHYPTGGAGAVRPHLKGTHSDIAIRGMAKRLGVKLGEEYRRKPVTKELLRDLERAYRSGKRGAIKALAERQGVNYDWLKNVAAEHGLRADESIAGTPTPMRFWMTATGSAPAACAPACAAPGSSTPSARLWRGSSIATSASPPRTPTRSASYNRCSASTALA